MQNLETLFVRELRDSVVFNGAKDIYKIPLPQECVDGMFLDARCMLYEDVKRETLRN